MLNTKDGCLSCFYRTNCFYRTDTQALEILEMICCSFRIFRNQNIESDIYEGQSQSPWTLFLITLSSFKKNKFYFIFRKRSFHSLINAHIKQITAVVPEKIDSEYAWGSRSGTRQI